jgi:hypothetical protein
MRRGAELLAFVLFVLGGCEGEGVDPIDVQVEFANPSIEGSTIFEVECDPFGEQSPICAEIRRTPEVYFPEESMICTIPVDFVYANIRGSYQGEELQQTLTCSDTDMRAIAAWSELLGFEAPRLRDG